MIQIFMTDYLLYLAMIKILVTVCLPAVSYNDTDFHDRLPAVSCYDIDFGDGLPAVSYYDTDFHDRLPAVSCYDIGISSVG